MSVSLLKKAVAVGLLVSTSSSWAAIALDRTRVIFPGSEKSVALTISNENQEKPYLAQAWLENEQGQKITSPLLATPPMQRVEPGSKSIIRIDKTAAVASLPQDRESFLWFNVREIPPRSDRPNVMQIALQTRVKLFYRPAAIMPEKFSHWDDQLVLHRLADGYNVENPTPYYVTVLAVTGAEKETVAKEFKPVMIAPKSTAKIKSKTFSVPYITTINDFGGRPVTGYLCSGDTCRAKTRA